MNSRHTWLEVNMAAIRSNFAKMSDRIRPCRILAVLKNDAYGLGALPIARALKQEGDAFQCGGRLHCRKHSCSHPQTARLRTRIIPHP